MKIRNVGQNLYIQENASGSESWIVRVRINGKQIWRGLGNVKYVSKKQAREDAQRILLALRSGDAPIAMRTAPTFSEILPLALNDIQNARQWKDTKMRRRWESTLASIAVPVLGKMPVDRIETNDVLRCLKPTWITKPVITSRTRMRIEAVLNWCTMKKYRKGPNPATWKGNLEFALPLTSKIHVVRHHEAPTVEDLRKVVAYCRAHPSIVSGIILLIIATAGRVQECARIHRDEIDGDVWTVPADRMKANGIHRVPLTSMAKEALAMGSPRNAVIFPGVIKTYTSLGSPRLKLIDILKRPVTAHGIRSTFKDWCSREGVAEVVSEKALAHKWGNETTEAYLRDDLLARRRDLMEKWAKTLS